MLVQHGAVGACSSSPGSLGKEDQRSQQGPPSCPSRASPCPFPECLNLWRHPRRLSGHSDVTCPRASGGHGGLGGSATPHPAPTGQLPSRPLPHTSRLSPLPFPASCCCLCHLWSLCLTLSSASACPSGRQGAAASSGKPPLAAPLPQACAAAPQAATVCCHVLS